LKFTTLQFTHTTFQEEEDMSKKKVKARDGKVFEVDTSDEACGKFGVKHGDKIINCQGRTCVVEGVAPANERMDPEPDVLWRARDIDNGRVSYCYPLGPNCLRPA
jgi:hypothetical protein